MDQLTEHKERYHPDHSDEFDREELEDKLKKLQAEMAEIQKKLGIKPQTNTSKDHREMGEPGSSKTSILPNQPKPSTSKPAKEIKT